MRFLARISIRLLLFNVLLVFLPAAAILYLEVYEGELLEAQERAMVQQGRLAAAALGGQGELGAGAAKDLVRRLEGRSESRVRIVDRRGTVLADSARQVPPRPVLPPDPSSSSPYERIRSDLPEARDTPLYQLGAWLYRTARKLGFFSDETITVGSDGSVGSVRSVGSDEPGTGSLGNRSEVRAALAGRYGATTRVTGSGERSMTLYSAIPIRSEGRVVGAVLVSQSTTRILRALRDVRLDIFRVVVASVAVASILSLLVSATIARPLRRLRDEANALLDRRGRLRGRFRGSEKLDEIGDLSRSLEQLTGRLQGHLRFIESFASDLSHELKNPLAAVRTATEMLAEVEDPADRRRFLEIVQREVARMERLLSGVREVTEIDAGIESERAVPVDLGALLPRVIESVRLRTGDRAQIDLRAPADPVPVTAVPERLTQVFENLLDNAIDFSPPGGRVTVSLQPAGMAQAVIVEDEGPGIPPEHRERIFDRFFSWRPESGQARNGHMGLGLAIVKAIAEGYGGSVAAGERAGGGARIEVWLPTADV